MKTRSTTARAAFTGALILASVLGGGAISASADPAVTRGVGHPVAPMAWIPGPATIRASFSGPPLNDALLQNRCQARGYEMINSGAIDGFSCNRDAPYYWRLWGWEYIWY